MISEFSYLKHLLEGHDKNKIVRRIADAYGRDIWNYAYSVVGNADLADDIMQDVFIKILEKLHTYRGESSMKTWLLSITRNTAYNSRSKLRFRKTLLLEIWNNQHFHPSAESVVIEQIEINNAWRSVLKLPVKLREVLVLFVHHDMSVKEIAETIGVPEGTVKSRLHHARRKFVKQYKRGEG